MSFNILFIKSCKTVGTKKVVMVQILLITILQYKLLLKGKRCENFSNDKILVFYFTCFCYI